MEMVNNLNDRIKPYFEQLSVLIDTLQIHMSETQQHMLFNPLRLATQIIEFQLLAFGIYFYYSEFISVKKIALRYSQEIISNKTLKISNNSFSICYSVLWPKKNCRGGEPLTP